MVRRSLIVALIFLIIGILGFSSVLTLTLWTAPNPNQDLFWRTIVSEWNKTHPDIQIKWSEIPAAGTSEEAILTAIASGRAPDFCDNIFSGFGAELVDSNQLVPLDTLPGFNDLVKQRDMENIIKNWEYKGHFYFFPEYINPMLVWWRKDILEEYGFSQPPRTYSQIYELAKKVVIPHKRYAYQAQQGISWYNRWYDFIADYYAASGGKAYIDPSRGIAFLNNEYSKDVATFIYTLFKNNWTAIDMGSEPLYTGAVVGMINGPWEIPYAMTQFPKIFANDIVVTPLPVPDNYPSDKPVYTFADSKSMVIFKTTKEKELAAWEFMKWVWSNPENDVLWVKITQMPPAREDLLTNPIFKPYLENKIFAEYAKYVPYAIPPAFSSKTVSIQEAMTNDLIEPLIYLQTTPEKAIEKLEADVNNILFQ